MVVYPNKLIKGDTIGITAPSMGANLCKIDRAISNIKDYGYNVIETESVRKEKKLVSTDAKSRAKEFIELWENPDVKLILAARGGEFIIEILPYLNEYFKKEEKLDNPKWVQGYSDISTLLFYLTMKYNIATIQASNLSDYAMNPWHKSLANTFEFIENGDFFVQSNFKLWEKEENKDDLTYQFNLTEKSNCKTLDNVNNVEFSGRLIGGCLESISTLLGTKWDNVYEYISHFEEEGIVWHIENCAFDSAEIYRKLFLMKEHNWFKNTKGILIGRTRGGESIEDFEYIDSLKKGLGDLNIPVIYDLDIGHIPPQWTMINGANICFKYDKGKCLLKQKFTN